MRRYTHRTMLACVLLGMSMSALAQWQEGDFSGNLNWQGTVTQNRNPWSWAQGNLPPIGTLSQKDLQVEGRSVAWHNLLTNTPLLVGKTEQLMPAGRPGVAPVINFGRETPGFSLTWKSPGVAQVTVPVTGKGDHGTQTGSLTFLLRVSGAMVATTAGQRLGFGVVAADNDDGNGLPPTDMALAYEAAVSALQAMAGADTPAWLASNVTPGGTASFSALHDGKNQAAGAVYGAQILPGSGTLRFAAGQVPESWHVSLPIRITYR